VDLAPLLAAIRQARVDNRSIAAWSLYAAESRRVSLGTKDRETGNPHAPLALAEGLVVRAKLVWDDGKVSRGAYERRQVEIEPGLAIAAARASAFDAPDAGDVAAPATFPEVPVHDARAAAIAAGAVEPLVPRLSAIREQVAYRGVRTWSGSLYSSEGTSRVVTSAGLDVSGTGTAAGWSATLDGEIGAGWSARALDAEPEFDERLQRLITTVLSLREPAKARPGGTLPVLLHPDVVEEYVLAVLLHNLDGTAVAHGTGAFVRDQFGSGSPVLREDLSLRHDPLVPMAGGAYRFTQEGVPASPVTFVERGRLCTPLLDLKYGRRLGLAPTANPSAMDTLFLEGSGPLSYDAALANASGGALVLNVLGVHTQDFTSGDFSLAAPQALAIDAGTAAGRLRATISGNLFDLLRSGDLALVRFPGEHTPGLLVRCRADFA